ncbi:hypothetical protein E3J62_01315 [candidate division TA06 bacterium]|uniref:ATP-binding protein n=1 Tax=candidate division TA06 bacterium TaxID=2250710 RepID=A0A523UYA3_UNCT6|nr:MAG: hypothetical protein E3J62_01315 [candidate division TA06 bacterium]
MTNDTLSAGLSNPFSTGGGGVAFEQLVGASYLVSLLAGDIPRGLDWGISKAVAFQQRMSGYLLDDVVVTATDGQRQRKLALQVKHDLTFSDAPSNTEFARVIADCWGTFAGAQGSCFDESTDRVGIGIGVYQRKVARHFQQLLGWSRKSASAADFIRLVQVSGFSSDEKRKYLGVITNLLARAKGAEVTDDETWRFLRCLVVIHFDVENPGSRDSTHCWNRLLDVMKERDAGSARLLLDALTALAAEYARSGGVLDETTVRGRVSPAIGLKDSPDFASDLRSLREHSDRVLGSIDHTIGGRIHLPRLGVVEQLEASIDAKDMIVITGEPMLGKSALLKLLATRLRNEGEIIALSVERLWGTTIEGFLHNINVQSDLKDILSAVGAAPFRCILIDGLERVTDQDKRRVLNDIITEVRGYNNSVLTKGGHRQNCWKLVFTCRRQEATEVLQHLETRKNLVDRSLEILEVGSLNGDEVAEVVDQLPKLRSLAKQTHLKEILSRPLVLDILTLPDVSPPPGAVPRVLTESWLIDWFWKEVVRRANSYRPGRGSPDKREELMIRLAEESLKGCELGADGLDVEALSGLLSDRLVVKEGPHLRFGHDVFEDWASTVLLHHHEADVAGFLAQTGEPLSLTRPFRLYSSKLLEVEQSPDRWLKLLRSVESSSGLSPRWHQTALAAPLLSPLLRQLLTQLRGPLFEDDASLLNEVLKVLRTVCVRPSPTALLLFGDLPESELEKYLAYLTVPDPEQWIPVIELVLADPDMIKGTTALEFSYIAEKWMTNTEKTQPLRVATAKTTLGILNGGLLESYELEPKNRYLKSVLWAADSLPEVVDKFVREKAPGNHAEGTRGFEDLFLDNGWVPIVKHLPRTAVDVLKIILCKELEPGRYGTFDHLLMNLGIRSTRWNPPTYFKGPFLGLLRLHSDEGLELIHHVTNHATRCWRMREEQEWGRSPSPQTVRLRESDVHVWGDELVFGWYRYPSVAPEPVTCALMALEYWMREKVKSGADPGGLFDGVLGATESVAVVGVCLSVALANYQKCMEAAIPIVENPAFWVMDTKRAVQDMMAEGGIIGLSTYLSLGHDKGDYKILLDLSREPHRRLDIHIFALPILVSGSEANRRRFQDAMDSFPDNPPILYEDEKENHRLLQDRIETCKIMAAQADLENYETFDTGVKGGAGIRFRLPPELEKKQEEKLRILEERKKLDVFQVWSMNFLDRGDVGQAYTMESAMGYAQRLASLDDPSYRPRSFLEDSEIRAQAIAAFAATLVVHQWEWAEKNRHISWCRDQLLTASRRQEPPPELHDQVSMYSMGYRRSAARALPLVLLRFPEDKGVRRALLRLALHRNHEVRAYLFSGLKALWATDEKAVRSYINAVVKSSLRRGVDQKFWFLKKQEGVRVAWGRFSLRKMIIKHVQRIASLLRVQFHPRKIGDCTLDDVDLEYLQSTLYCLPWGTQILQISPNRRLLDFLENLLVFTVNNYIHFEKEGRSFNEWAHQHWNDLLFPSVANALLRLPENTSVRRFYDAILGNWEEAPAMMEEFLRKLRLVGTQPELEDRLVELWLDIGHHVLSSSYCKSLGGRLRDDIRNILGLLIFADPTGVMVWRIEQWEPLKRVTGFIGSWCDAVGHHPQCFSSLVMLLKTIGFCLVPESGIGWLYGCIHGVSDFGDFFEKSKATSPLAELLHDSWAKYASAIRQKPETLRQFAFLVDQVAEQGEGIAIRLQSKLQQDTRD